ncbi:DUF6251 family protein [Streptomyces cacaoi]|uniref:DUF6251 family protein n=1 Tax=Streptomyces cacaoi TaxID=1898 RepID=UPI003F4D43DC
MSDLLPAHQHSAGCGCYDPVPVHTPVPLPVQQPGQPVPQVVHVHQAPPDRTTQRVALGTGIGAGTVAAGVYFGPLLVGALSAIAITVSASALVVLVLAWGVVNVTRSVAGEAPSRTRSSARRGR